MRRDEGVRSMKKGERALLTCRSDYAYGKAGSPPKIPADATLNFEASSLSSVLLWQASGRRSCLGIWERSARLRKMKAIMRPAQHSPLSPCATRCLRACRWSC